MRVPRLPGHPRSMGESDLRSLRRTAAVLVGVSVLRWGWEHHRRPVGLALEGVAAQLEEQVDSALAAARERERPLDPGERIDPNRADADQLQRLPGVGPVTAAAIVTARSEGLVFTQATDLQSIRGIGPSTVGKIAEFLDFSSVPAGSSVPLRGIGRAPVDINRADSLELRQLPGIGPALARRIIAERERGTFRSVEELTRVSGIGPATLARLRPWVAVHR